MSKIAVKYWYKFLKLSEKYRKCCMNGGKGELASLYQDFGNVHALPFGKWWEGHKALFTFEPLFVIDQVKTKDEFDQLFDEDAGDELLAVIINLYAPKQVVLKKIDSLISRVHKKALRQENNLRYKAGENIKKKSGRPKLDGSFFHHYGLKSIPSERDLSSFDLMLKVYKACKREDAKPASKRKKRYQIGNSLEISFGSRKIASTDVSGNKILVASTTTHNTESEKIQMTATVCRYNRQAQEMIENVERGIFPQHG